MTNSLIVKLEASADLSPDDRRAVDAICTDRRTIASHEDLAREGDKPELVYFILDGWAARYKVLPDGSRQITAFLIPGDICDTGAAVLDRMDHSVIALTAVTIASVTRVTLAEATRERPVLAQAFRRSSAVDEAVLRTWVVNLGRRDAYSRVAHQICELHARLERVGMVRDGEFDLPLTQEMLADSLGLTSVHLNRTLQRLKTEGLIRLHSHRLTISDADRLAAAAGFDPSYLHSQQLDEVARR